MNVYPGDLLVQEHHKKLIKRNTISDFYAGRNGSTAVNDGGCPYTSGSLTVDVQDSGIVT